jgi:hypothetical protein
MARTSSMAPGRQDSDVSSIRRQSRGRPSAYKKRPANLDRHTCDMALDIVARKVEVAKANNGGVVKYKAITDIVESMKPTIPWLTKGMLRNHINKMKIAAARPGLSQQTTIPFDAFVIDISHYWHRFGGKNW